MSVIQVHKNLCFRAHAGCLEFNSNVYLPTLYLGGLHVLLVKECHIVFAQCGPLFPGPINFNNQRRTALLITDNAARDTTFLKPHVINA